MGGLLLFVFVVVCLLGTWRVFVATKGVHGNGQVAGSLTQGIPFFIAAALIFVFWMSFTTVAERVEG
jgi:hypothetical protein